MVVGRGSVGRDMVEEIKGFHFRPKFQFRLAWRINKRNSMGMNRSEERMNAILA